MPPCLHALAIHISQSAVVALQMTFAPTYVAQSLERRMSNTVAEIDSKNDVEGSGPSSPPWETYEGRLILINRSSTLNRRLYKSQNSNISCLCFMSRAADLGEQTSDDGHDDSENNHTLSTVHE